MAAVSSPSASPLSASHQEASSFDDVPMQQSLLFSDGLKGLRNMRSQLYSAADYFELSYINDDRKEIVMRTLKEYAVEAIVNAVDHLGSVSYKVNNLLNEEVDEVSIAESEVSCIEQRLRTCQACIDQEGLSQQSLSIGPPKYHKHYILRGESVADPATQPLKYEGYYPLKENSKPPRHHTATRRRPSPMSAHRNPRLSCPSPSLSPSLREPSLPPHNTRSTSPLPRLEKIAPKERRATSPVRASTSLMRARSVSNAPTIPHSSKQYVLETQNSLASLHADRNDKLMERNPTKKRGFFKGLLTRNRSWTDESLYSYLDEY